MSNIDLDIDHACSEDFRGKLMVDFANSSIGGGVLGHGAVQEEIIFLKHIEPLVCLVFTEELTDSESFVIIGSTRYNSTKGYSFGFEWEDNFMDCVSLDSSNRNDTHIVAIDAYDFSGKEHLQYLPRYLQRELDKCAVGFLGDPEETGLRGVASGKWGCGVFKGDEELKFLIQWLAASACAREFIFLTWDMKDLESLFKVLDKLRGKMVKEVYNFLISQGLRLQKGVFACILADLA